MFQLKANQDTFLKKKAVASSLLSTDEKKFIKKGDYIFVDRVTTKGNHSLCTLSYGSGDWYIFNNHWDNLSSVLSKNNSTRRIGKEGVNLIKKFEGLHKLTLDGRIESYKCAAGILTIGYGSTGSHVKPNMFITVKEAEDLLVKDLDRFEKAVNRLVKVKLNNNQFDALVSFAFNLGEGALASSTLLKRINNGDFVAASAEFLRWTKAGNKVLTGLVRRRKAERALFLSQPWQNF